MRFAFCLSTHGGSPLQGGLERGLRSLGHEVVDFHNGRNRDYDVFVLFNQCAHRIDYAFPDWPTYDVPVAFVDAAEYGYFRRLPEVVKNYANAFAPGSMSHDTKSVHEQMRIRTFLEGRSFPYFLREFSIHLDYPENYHPIDYPLYHLSVNHDRPTRADYLGRLWDFFVSWGGSHPWRWPITRALREVECKSEIRVIEEDGWPRRDQGWYFTRMRQSKATVTFDGYGSSSFRLTEALAHTLALVGPLSIKMRDPLTDGVNCVMYGLDTKGEECLGTDVADRLRWALEDPERAFRIFEAGYDHLMTHWTEEANARYFLSVLEKHDWSRPTRLALHE